MLNLMRLCFASILAFWPIFHLCAVPIAAQTETESHQEILLWPDGAPGALGTEAKDQPKIVVYRPSESSLAKQAGVAMLVVPGGGYGNLASDHEGTQIATWLNQHGITAAVLDYRHRGKGYGHPAPLQDAQRAIRYLRSEAAQLNVDPNKIGIIGFSAGGHLASTVCTHFDLGQSDAADRLEQVSCRPDFSILCYGVLQMGTDITHAGSQRNLLGDNPAADVLLSLCNDRQVNAQTPPTFLFHTNEDSVVLPQNSAIYYQALKANQVPCELHIFERGRHGVGLARDVPGTHLWPELCLAWLEGQNIWQRPAE